MRHHPLDADLNFVLGHTQSVWDELAGQRIFITGGTGFFGCWLLETLLFANERLNLNITVVVLTRDAQAFAKKYPHLTQNAALTLHEGDVRNFVFPNGHFSHVIHAATEASAKLNAEQPLLMIDTIVQGTKHTLDFAQHCQAQKFLCVSSGAVYGRQPPELVHIPEENSGILDSANPLAAYGIGKFTAEHYCHLFAKHQPLQIKIARCFAFVGPMLTLDTHFAIGNFILDSLAGRPIHIKGDGSPYRSYLYAADLVIWLWHILTRGESLRLYNVGSDHAVSIAELAHTVAGCFDADIKVIIDKEPDPQRLAERYVPSVARAQQELGLTQQVSLTDAIKRTAAWNLNHKDNY